MKPSPTTPLPPYTAFEGERQIASGDLHEVARLARKSLDKNPQAALLIFDNTTSRQMEIDFRGSLDEVLSRLPAPEKDEESTGETAMPRAGRPRLGVVPREVTLLPRHWEWLATQPGGASVTLRRLVEEARRANQDKDNARRAMESVDRFMNVMAGNLPHYEEASRAFYRKENGRFHRIIEAWPKDIRNHIKLLAEEVWPEK